MKRIFISIIMFFSIFFSLNVYAEEIKYGNVINDNTTIEEDFNVLGIELDNYYYSTTFEKAYVVAMSEAYVNNNIQTYFYVYIPANTGTIVINSLTYKINNIEKTYNSSQYYDLSRYCLYKYKGFMYEYKKEVNISISSIVAGTNKKIYSTGSYFCAKNTHSYLDGSFSSELNFNSTLIINEYKAFPVEIPASSNFASAWTEFWDIEEKDLYLHFYNFNFPNNIKPDSINYARFNYDMVRYVETWERVGTGINHQIKEVARNNLDKEYNPGTHKFKTNNFSQELSFETFVLGNRVTKGEFDYIDMSPYSTDFDYDCSILLDSTISTKLYQMTSQTNNNFLLENINFIELDYEIDGVIYKSQIVAPSIDVEDPPINPDVIDEESLFDIFLNWFKDNFPQSLIAIILVLILSGAIVTIIIGIIKTGIASTGKLIGNVIYYIFVTILKIIWFVIALPFKGLKALINRKKD